LKVRVNQGLLVDLELPVLQTDVFLNWEVLVWLAGHCRHDVGFGSCSNDFYDETSGYTTKAWRSYLESCLRSEAPAPIDLNASPALGMMTSYCFCLVWLCTLIQHPQRTLCWCSSLGFVHVAICGCSVSKTQEQARIDIGGAPSMRTFCWTRGNTSNKDSFFS